MNNHIPKQLLTFKNTKTIKSLKYGWKTFILYMSPFTQNATGKNVCSHASKGCAEACLFGSGFGGIFTSVEKARMEKTNFFLSNRFAFFELLCKEIEKIVAAYKDKEERVCIRLNGTSDIAWEKFKAKDGKSIMELFPDVQFYDYTKNYLRFNNILPKNYHLTFSRSETNDQHVDRLLSQGHNVAIVFDELPETYNGYKVINGDLSDLRFEERGQNVVVGLKYKKMTGKGSDNKKAFQSGFALKKKELQVVTKAA